MATLKTNIEPVKEKDKKNLIKMWRPIFRTDDPFQYPFQERVQESMLFWETEGSALSELQYDVLCKAIKAIGEEGFIITETEMKKKFLLEGNSWWCRFPLYRDYIWMGIGIENALYSAKGTWGLIISHEDHAIVGGSSEFISVLKKEYPRWKQDLEDLKEYWAEISESDWLNGVLKRIIT